MSAPAPSPAPSPAGPSPAGQSYWSIVRRQVRKNRSAMFGFWSVLTLLFVAIYAPVVASNRPFYYSGPEGTSWPWFEDMFDRNQVTQNVDVFFNLLMIFVPPALLGFWVVRRILRARGTWRTREIRRTALVLGGIFLWVLAGLVLSESAASSPLAKVVFAPGVALRTSKPAIDWHQRVAAAKGSGADVTVVFPPIPYHYAETRPAESTLPPDWFMGKGEPGAVGKHPLGTDVGGKDVLAGLLFGTRISITIGAIAVAIYITIGVILGSLAGYFGGWVDIVVSRFVEIMLCFPTLFFILTIISVFDTRTIFLVMLAIGVTGWPGVARLVRGEFLRERNLDYVTAARAMAIPQRRVIFRHVLPNAMTPVLVSATFGIAGAILTESTISFLGLGDLNTASWGLLLNLGRQNNLEWLILAPGAAIFFTVTVFNLLGEGLRDALDPKRRA